MTDRDFRQLKAVTTPQSWIDNALNIPNKKNKKPFPLMTVIGTAAGIAVAVAASLFIFFTVSRAPVAVPPEYTVPQTVTVPVTIGEGSQPSTRIEENETKTSAAAPTASSGVTPPRTTAPRVTEPSVTEPAEASTAPTVSPTTVPPEEPTEHTTDVVPDDTEEQPAAETEAPEPAAPSEYFQGYFKAGDPHSFDTAGTVFCHITGADGKEYGGRYSAAERAEVSRDSSGEPVVRYSPQDHNILLPDDSYTVEFYAANGVKGRKRTIYIMSDAFEILI